MTPDGYLIQEHRLQSSQFNYILPVSSFPPFVFCFDTPEVSERHACSKHSSAKVINKHVNIFSQVNTGVMRTKWSKLQTGASKATKLSRGKLCEDLRAEIKGMCEVLLQSGVSILLPNQRPLACLMSLIRIW